MGTMRNAAAILTGRRPVVHAPRQRATVALGGLSGGLGALGPVGTLDGVGAQLVLSAEERGYEHTAVAYRCLMLIAQNLASVPMVVLAGDDARTDHEVAQLWNVGVAGAPVSARLTREALFAKAELGGEAYAFIDRGPTGEGKAVGIHVIYDRVKVVVGKDERGIAEHVKGFIVGTGKDERALLPSEMLWLRYPHPTQRWGSLAPWKAALYASESDAYARAWQRAEFINNARPSSLINLGEVSDETYAAALSMIRTRTAGPANAGKSMVIRTKSGATSAVKPSVQHLSLSPAEMSYLESRTANADEVMMAFGVNPDLLRSGSTYENRATAKTALWSDLLLGKLDVIGSEVDRQLLPNLDETAAWDLSGIDALRESQDAIVKRASQGVYPDIITIDEARATLGYEPLPGGMGGYTLTPYRLRQTNIGNAETLMPLDVGERAAPPRTLRHQGTTIVHREARKGRTAAQVQADRLATYARHERIGVKAVARLAARQEKAVLRALASVERRRPGAIAAHRERLRELVRTGQAQLVERAGVHYLLGAAVMREGGGDWFDLRHWIDETEEALEPFMEGVFAEGAQTVAQQFGGEPDEFNDLVMNEMGERLEVLAEQVTTTTRQILEAEVLQDGIPTGDSIPDLADRIRTVFSGLSKSRATTIARTETIGGYNAASHAVAKAAGFVVQREWLATEDERTRMTHVKMHGQRIEGMDTMWPIGVMYPGDPNGPADETINCRCVELFIDPADA